MPSTKVRGWWTKELSKYPVIWGKPGLSFFSFSFPSELCTQVWTWKGRGVGKDFIWICKGVFWKSTFLKGSTVQHWVCSFKMLRNWMGAFTRNHIFLSFYLLKIITFFPPFFSIGGIKERATAAHPLMHACYSLPRSYTLFLPPPWKECSIRQIMNHFIQIHILFGRCCAQAGMLRVKKLDYQSPSNHRNTQNSM